MNVLGVFVEVDVVLFLHCDFLHIHNLRVKIMSESFTDRYWYKLQNFYSLAIEDIRLCVVVVVTRFLFFCFPVSNISFFNPFLYKKLS